MPHFVSLAKNGKTTCEDCPGWKSLKLCSHTVAAAEKSGRLLKYVKWLKEKGPSRMNITSYVTCDREKERGKREKSILLPGAKEEERGKRPPVVMISTRVTCVNTLV